jgi:hypothetical protein
VKSEKVCIALLFVGIDSEHRVGLGGNLGGLRLKETRLFVSTSTEMYATFVVGRTSGIILVSLAFTFRCIFVFFVFLSSTPGVSYLPLI